jgi:hypothetical protein
MNEPWHPDTLVAGVFLVCALSMYANEIKEKLRFWK